MYIHNTYIYIYKLLCEVPQNLALRIEVVPLAVLVGLQRGWLLILFVLIALLEVWGFGFRGLGV